MPRYELTGEFFWAIELADKTLTTSVGRIGMSGHTRVKAYGSAAEAKREYAALVAEKLEQGYALASVPPPLKKPTKQPAKQSARKK